MADNYDWKVVDSCFVLHQDNDPTGTIVGYYRGGWQVTDNGKLLVIDGDSPSDAINFVNKDKGIEAPYDEAEGIERIINYLDSEIKTSLRSVARDILDLRDDLTMLKGIRDDQVSKLSYGMLDDELQIAYGTLEIVRDRYNYPIDV